MNSVNKLNNDLQKESINVKRAFTKFKISLDSTLSENAFRGDGFFSAPFKSVWVSGYSDSSFQAKMKVNPKTDQGEGISLKPNMALNFDMLINGALIYSDSDQAGAWIELTFAHYSAIDSGSIAVDVGGKSTITEGSNFSCEKSAEITSTPSLAVPSNSDRTVTTIVNNSGAEVWFGTQVALTDADYVNICPSIGDGESLRWKNSSGLYFRKDAANVDTLFLKLFHEIS